MKLLEDPKGDTLQGQQQLQQTSTQDISTTKQEKGLPKQLNCNINISKLYIKAGKFQGGNLRNNFLAWTIIISDTFVLNILQQGLKLSFTGDMLINVPFECKRSQLEQTFIAEEVCKPIRKKDNFMFRREIFSQIFLFNQKKTDHIVLS